MGIKNSQKVSDYVAEFISQRGVDTVFAVSGGACLHLIHSIDAHPSLTLVCPLHEQSAATAADAYARSNKKLGVAIATSGPGATNLITGICCSYYDSVPTLFVTGQVSTFRMVGATGARQIGFQETPIVDLVASITKYAVTINDPQSIRYELEKAVFLSKNGRPGPVLIDIPDNLQRQIIDPDSLVAFQPIPAVHSNLPDTEQGFERLSSMIRDATRPVIVAGWGILLAGQRSNFFKFVESLSIPVALTWGAADLLPENHFLNIGRFGTHGGRHTNFIVQNADLILALGTRLDTKSTGSPITTFARGAKKIVVDIDPAELNKFAAFGLNVDLLIHDDVGRFFEVVERKILNFPARHFESWYKQIEKWEVALGGIDHSQRSEISGIDPYKFIRLLSHKAPDDAVVVIDTGCAVAWVMQAWEVQLGQRLFHDCNNTAMGWSLGAALGCHFATPEKPLIVIVGDGSLMMAVQELASIRRHNIPVKIFLLNNSGYAMIQQTQDQWLSSYYCASSVAGGLGFPDFKQLATAFNYRHIEISEQAVADSILNEELYSGRAVIFEVVLSSAARVIPQVKFGRPNEDMHPLLPRDFFADQMIIDLYKPKTN